MTNKIRPNQTPLLEITKGSTTYRLTSAETATGSRVFTFSTLQKTAKGGIVRTDTQLSLGIGRAIANALIAEADTAADLVAAIVAAKSVKVMASAR